MQSLFPGQVALLYYVKNSLILIHNTSSMEISLQGVVYSCFFVKTATL